MARELSIHGANLRLVLPEEVGPGDPLPPDYTERLAAILAPARVRCDLSPAVTEPYEGLQSLLTGVVFAFALPDEPGPDEDPMELAAPAVARIEELLVQFFVESEWSAATAEIVTT